VEATRPAVAALVAWAQGSTTPWALAIARRSEALLAGGEEACERFEAALALHGGAPRDLQRARTELLYGEHLRRARRKADARPHLRAARDTFESLRAAPWAARAAGELRATGETARRRDAATLDELTPQELQIARLVAGGRTNRDVAAQLFVSPKTVEYHLGKVFAKLAVGSRTELAHLASEGAIA
jgi:DNA-binding CsgD family transcriptional regulator